MLKAAISRVHKQSTLLPTIARCFGTPIDKSYITTIELEVLLETNPENLRILDCSVGPDTLERHSAGHIKGSQWFDLSLCRDFNSPWPHMIPKQPYFI